MCDVDSKLNVVEGSFVESDSVVELSVKEVVVILKLVVVSSVAGGCDDDKLNVVDVEGGNVTVDVGVVEIVVFSSVVDVVVTVVGVVKDLVVVVNGSDEVFVITCVRVVPTEGAVSSAVEDVASAKQLSTIIDSSWSSYSSGDVQIISSFVMLRKNVSLQSQCHKFSDKYTRKF
jgi:hypothetical protein